MSDFSEAQGINTLVDLERAERLLQLRLADELMQAGCLIRDRSRLDIRGAVSVGRSVEIDVNVVFEGKVVLGDDVRIGANCVLKDVTVQAGNCCEAFFNDRGITDRQILYDRARSPESGLKLNWAIMSKSAIMWRLKKVSSVNDPR